MKKILLFLCTFLMLGQIDAYALDVLLGKNKVTEISFLQNYAVVINKDHYYGPFSKDTSLRVEMFDENHIKLLIKYMEEDEVKYKDLGYTSSRVNVVRSLNDKVNFNKTVKPQKAKSKKISSKDIKLIKQSFNAQPFFQYTPPGMSGWIEFSGPLSIYVREQSKSHFYVVEKIPLENYLIHVTNCEMRVAANKEAYKAQSILARTFVVRKLTERLDKQNKTRENWYHFHLFPDERDQAYICEMRVNNQLLPNTDIMFAVWETRNKILIDENKKVLKINYCAYCGECAYCTANGYCKTENGYGDCQNAIAYYTSGTFKKGEKTIPGEKRNLTYKEVLKKFHPNATIADYHELKNNPLGGIAENIVEENDLEEGLQNIQINLQNMI